MIECGSRPIDIAEEDDNDEDTDWQVKVKAVEERLRRSKKEKEAAKRCGAALAATFLLSSVVFRDVWLDASSADLLTRPVRCSNDRSSAAQSGPDSDWNEPGQQSTKQVRRARLSLVSWPPTPPSHAQPRVIEVNESSSPR